MKTAILVYCLLAMLAGVVRSQESVDSVESGTPVPALTVESAPIEGFVAEQEGLSAEAYPVYAHLMEMFRNAQTAILADYTQASRSTMNDYGESLQQYLRKAQMNGDMVEFAAAKKESDRFTAEGTLSEVNLSDVATLRYLQRPFANRYQSVLDLRSERAIQVQIKLVESMNAIQREWSSQARFDDAIYMIRQVDKVQENVQRMRAQAAPALSSSGR